MKSTPTNECYIYLCNTVYNVSWSIVNYFLDTGVNKKIYNDYFHIFSVLSTFIINYDLLTF